MSGLASTNLREEQLRRFMRTAVGSPTETVLRIDWAGLRDRAARLSQERQIGFAREYVHQAAREFWRKLHPHRPVRVCPSVDFRLDEDIRQLAQATGKAAASMDEAQAAYQLATLYAHLLPETTRSQNGIYFTPPVLVDRLISLACENGFDWETGSAIDPACGGGAFVAPLARQMADHLQRRKWQADKIMEHIAGNLAGVEKDGFLAWLTQVWVDSALAQYVPSYQEIPTIVHAGDALELSRTLGRQFSLVIGNPPYGRVSLPDALRERFGQTLYGHANLYGVFVHLATELTGDQGLLAFVTPTSFLGGLYYKNLRGFLRRSCPLRAIDFVTDRSGVFKDVLQETCLSVFRKSSRDGRISVSGISPGRGGDSCQVVPIGQVKLGEGLVSPWILPREKKELPLCRLFAHMPTRLRDLGFEVKTGPLVWNRHKDQLRQHPSKKCYPLIWAESVQRDGAFLFSCQRHHRATYVKLREGQGFLVTRQPCILVQRTTAKEQSRRLVAAVLGAAFLGQYGGAIVENHLNVIVPSGRPEISLRALAALLNSSVLDRLFRCVNGSVAVSAYELEQLPLPPVESMRELSGLLDQRAGPGEVESFLATRYGVSLE
jgi:adenine-specific DNA-methyltransferase